ncbi:DUF1501 domain-containing protein [Frigoriglobus tundricola]|uniref:Uncharacterized DUF1501 protein, type 2 n=1 Tax=Frigoriglobus tundricola TaxID=2774151 RepID=A0A6M5Z000_9BACT|nr:DUF1501 domain-containing protein [Frigoriglobus tundricola]QJW99114.1 Uncharacterized DUF1501 protein, type 2 [Frigoriglobus tundricola]
MAAPRSSLRAPHSVLRAPLDRRHLLRVGAVSTAVSMSGWMGRLARAAEEKKVKPKRSCILLWMFGGPSTIDLWDLKVGHENGGPYKEIEAAPDLKICEHLPKIAKHGKSLAVLRGMSTKEGDHIRGEYLMKTGQLPGAAGIQYPGIGALVAKELGDPRAELPNFVSIAPQRFVAQDANGPGFLGPVHAPLVVGDNQFNNNVPAGNIDAVLKVADLDRRKGIDEPTAAARLDLLREVQDDFAAGRPGSIARSHAAAYDRAVRLMQSDGGKVFDLTAEKDATRDKYGRNLFGQGCLLARRLVEKGVPFVEVTLGNWDTHGQNFDQVKGLCGTLDAAWAALMDDLKDRGLLETTTIVWMGEFGRTPKINAQKGRDHFPNAWSTVLAGGGIKGGRAVGKTSKDGTTVEERVTPTVDLLATVCSAVGIDFEKQNMSNVGRPIRIVEKGAQPVTEVLA